jgi:hypothetical protein
MLLRVDTQTKIATRQRGIRLTEFGLDERGLQDILFRSLDRLIPDDELVLVMQSRHWQEEPDIMALSADGTLFIFELKAWESRSENLLQVLRYGQIYGQYSYEQLDALFRSFIVRDHSLKDTHHSTFDVELPEVEYNKRQVFVVMTNGLDHETREAVQYWRRCGLDVRPWVYRAYKDTGGQMLLEISPFATRDNPYEDIEEGFCILNTNYGNNPKDHEMMLRERCASAFYSPWKEKIKRISKGDVVFLYQSGVGIVAVGVATGNLQKREYEGHPNEDFSMPLTRFEVLPNPMPAWEIKQLCGVNYRFMSTLFWIDAEAGRKLEAALRSRNKKK